MARPQSYIRTVVQSSVLKIYISTNTPQRRYTLINFSTSIGEKNPFFVFYDEEKQFTRAWSSVVNGEARAFYTNNEIPVPENLPTYGLMTLRDDKQNVWNMRGIAIMGANKGMFFGGCASTTWSDHLLRHEIEIIVLIYRVLVRCLVILPDG